MAAMVPHFQISTGLPRPQYNLATSGGYPSNPGYSSTYGAPTPEDESQSPRTRKKMREKERRQMLNAHYNTLLRLLRPAPKRRMEKTTILEETIKLMQTLMETNSMLSKRNKAMEGEISLLRGDGGGGTSTSGGKAAAPSETKPMVVASNGEAKGASGGGDGMREPGSPQVMVSPPPDRVIGGTVSPQENVRQRLENVSVTREGEANDQKQVKV